MKFEFNWPSGFRVMFENVERQTDGQQSHWYTFGSGELKNHAWVDPEGGQGVQTPTEKSPKYRVS